jgi:hypothetical protein
VKTFISKTEITTFEGKITYKSNVVLGLKMGNFNYLDCNEVYESASYVNIKLNTYHHICEL